VRRIRSQLEQNGSETGLTKPISPALSAKRKRRAVEQDAVGRQRQVPDAVRAREQLD
jgi:hypothetical protein